MMGWMPLCEREVGNLPAESVAVALEPLYMFFLE